MLNTTVINNNFIDQLPVWLGISVFVSKSKSTWVFNNILLILLVKLYLGLPLVLVTNGIGYNKND